MARATLKQRISEYVDRRTAEADALATVHGLTVDARSRWDRTYRDPRCDDLRQARSAGCECVPMCRALPGLPVVCRATRVALDEAA